MNADVYYAILPTPIGDLLISCHSLGLTGVHVVNEKHAPAIEQHWIRSAIKVAEPIDQLNQYFAGERFDFDLKLSPLGTHFQRRVWQGLSRIPYGKTCSYGDLARELGCPKASRAIGMANGRNPISIIVPCHRVIGANGALTGYGGGLAAKRWLLDHEARHQKRNLMPIA